MERRGKRKSKDVRETTRLDFYRDDGPRSENRGFRIHFNFIVGLCHHILLLYIISSSTSSDNSSRQRCTAVVFFLILFILYTHQNNRQQSIYHHSDLLSIVQFLKIKTDTRICHPSDPLAVRNRGTNDE